MGDLKKNFQKEKSLEVLEENSKNKELNDEQTLERLREYIKVFAKKQVEKSKKEES